MTSTPASGSLASMQHDPAPHTTTQRPERCRPTPTHDPATGVRFLDEDFQRGLRTALDCCRHHAADRAEVLATASRIADGDPDSWLDEWMATAGAAWSAALDAEQAGRRAAALAHYRRAATYYALALQRVFHSSEPERHPDIWRRQRACWERVVDLEPVPGQRLAIPYEGATLPGFFFPAPDAQPGEARPLVVLNNGLQAPTSHMQARGGTAASARGYHWMTFDGPGQQGALYQQRIVCRPDWEAVLTPVLDALLRRPDVDPRRVAVIGTGEGGYLVARALCFEHRFAVAVADPGILDLSSPWIGSLVGPMRHQLEARDREAFDREMHLAELFSPSLSAELQLQGQPYGDAHNSRFELYRTLLAYRIEQELSQIATPLLITDPEAERWPGQARQLYDRCPAPRTLVRLPGEREAADPGEREAADPGEREAADPGETAAGTPRDSAIFDWLEQQLGAAG